MNHKLGALPAGAAAAASLRAGLAGRKVGCERQREAETGGGRGRGREREREIDNERKGGARAPQGCGQQVCGRADTPSRAECPRSSSGRPGGSVGAGGGRSGRPAGWPGRPPAGPRGSAHCVSSQLSCARRVERGRRVRAECAREWASAAAAGRPNTGTRLAARRSAAQRESSRRRN